MLLTSLLHISFSCTQENPEYKWLTWIETNYLVHCQKSFHCSMLKTKNKQTNKKPKNKQTKKPQKQNKQKTRQKQNKKMDIFAVMWRIKHYRQIVAVFSICFSRWYWPRSILCLERVISSKVLDWMKYFSLVQF